MFYFEEPLRLFGKGDYALTDVKKMTGTEGFFNLDVQIRNCQTKESLLECQAEKYLDTGKKKCKCVPHQLRSFSRTVRVYIHTYFEVMFMNIVNDFLSFLNNAN